MWMLNDDKTISPDSFSDVYIGIDDKEETENGPSLVLKLIKIDKNANTDGQPELIYFTNY